MVSEEPIDGRCGTRCRDKSGIEIHANDYSVVFTDGELADSTVSYGDHRGYVVEGELTDLDRDDLPDRVEDEERDYAPVIERVCLHHDDQDEGGKFGPVCYVGAEYIPCVSRLRHGYNVHSIEVHRESVPDQIDLDEHDHEVSDGGYVELIVEDDDPYVTNRYVEITGYCERYPMDNGFCYDHGGSNDPDCGYPAPDGNTRAMIHGLLTRRSSYYKQLDDDEQEDVHRIAESWLEDLDDDDNFARVNEVFRIAIDQYRLWKAHDQFRDADGPGGLVTTVEDFNDDGEKIEKEVEHPANLPYSRLDGDVYSKLKKLGITDDDEDSTNVDISLAGMFADRE